MKKYCFMIVLILIVILSACSSQTSTQQAIDQNNKQESISNDNKEEKNLNLTEEKVKEVLKTYREAFMKVANETAKDGKVKQYNAKEKLVSHFQMIMSKDLANRLVNTYFKENNDQLYIKSMDAPIWLNSKEPFKINKENNKEYNIIQEQNSELTGDVKIIFTLTYDNQNWLVKNVKQQHLTKMEDGYITEEKAIAIVRQSLRISADSDTKVEIDHLDEDGNYVIHVYHLIETKDGSHTATLGWYKVDKKDGGVKDIISNKKLD